MSQLLNFPKRLEIPAALADMILMAAVEMARQTGKTLQPVKPTRKRGATLRPGRLTPLWNELRRELGPYLTRYGDQAKLGRVLGLPRQRVQAFMTQGNHMPDAERTLQLLAWLMAVRNGRRPA